MIYKTDYISPVGRLTLAADNKSLIGLWIEGQKYFGSGIKDELVAADSLEIFNRVKDWLDCYFGGLKPDIKELSLSPQGSLFQKTVWGLLMQIPYGETVTYKTLAGLAAEKLNYSQMSAQAIGGAVGHNPISIIIPCHRVVGVGGSLTGYAGGIGNKVKLLELEGVDLTKFYIPPVCG